VANYRVSTNTNKSNKTTEDKTNKNKKTRTKQRKMDQLRRFKLKHDLLKISLDLQTAFAADTHLAEGTIERGKITYVPSRNTNAGCLQDRGALFSATKTFTR
jgi:hypothetical protein